MQILVPVVQTVKQDQQQQLLQIMEHRQQDDVGQVRVLKKFKLTILNKM